MSLLFRTIVKNVAVPICFAMAALSALLLLGRLVPLLETLLRAGVTPGELGHFLLLLIPTFLVLVVPMASLIGVVVGFLRMSRDSEVLALLACGVGPLRLVLPVAAVALVTWAATFATAATVLPMSKKATGAFIRNLTERRIARGLPEKTFLLPVPTLAMYVHKSRKNGRILQGVYMVDARDLKHLQVVLARWGEIFSRPGSGEVILRLSDGVFHPAEADPRVSDTLFFRSYMLRLAFRDTGGLPSRGEMGLRELAAFAARRNLAPDDHRRYVVELHKRLALPVGAFILTLLGMPLGILFGRTGLSGGVALGLGAFLSYYLLVAVGANLAEAGTLPPAALWAPNLVFAAATAWLLRHLHRRGPVRG
ncbi:YjgP/YjgQ family permease [Dissulfurirhabdus thermomarina]|nr:LptF/LptG family permease [Dissulfurirhabdus thermomarina]NMX23418.1 YjgP/YjgQ family permease [Dissulfurirhabdus thermomarina]